MKQKSNLVAYWINITLSNSVVIWSVSESTFPFCGPMSPLSLKSNDLYPSEEMASQFQPPMQQNRMPPKLSATCEIFFSWNTHVTCNDHFSYNRSCTLTTGLALGLWSSCLRHIYMPVNWCTESLSDLFRSPWFTILITDWPSMNILMGEVLDNYFLWRSVNFSAQQMPGGEFIGHWVSRFDILYWTYKFHPMAFWEVLNSVRVI